MEKKKSRRQIMLERRQEKRIDAIMDLAIDGDVKQLAKHKPEDLAITLVSAVKECDNLDRRTRELEKQLKEKWPGGRTSKYSDELKEEVRQFYRAGGQTYASTAAHFGMHKSTVGRILNNRKK